VYLLGCQEWGVSDGYVDQILINQYRDIYEATREFQAYKKSKLVPQSLESNSPEYSKITPNKMQKEALQNLQALRDRGENKALIISATGTGKTFLSAFDVAWLKPRRVLFIVHRRTIAAKSMETFMKLMSHRKMGLYSGEERSTADFLFATIQTIAKDVAQGVFKRDEFDYIVIDETHRADASSYQKILKHFTPRFLLGMTATPERTDGGDIFKLFDHNIAYEIRLHRALEEKMLVPFHYYGVSDLIVDGEAINDHTEFNKLVSDERADRISEKAKFYQTDSGLIRGLIFCSRLEEAKELAVKLNDRGLRTLALIGASKEIERQQAITDLEAGLLNYIITVDIFNEGVDIPSVNQVIMLRPTQSAIIFVQQLGRGLRTTEGKEYLTVIDFIGNYSNSYLIPIALYGDFSYNKDNLRKLIVGGSQGLPGASTIDFDRISQQQIFDAIDKAKLSQKRDLKIDYELVMKIVGRIPLMIDFVHHGSRDPYHFVQYSGSLCAFAMAINKEDTNILNSHESDVLSYLATLINDGKRLLDSLIVEALCISEHIPIIQLQASFMKVLNRKFTEDELNNSIHCVNLHFDTIKVDKKFIRIIEKIGFELCIIKGDILCRTQQFSNLIVNPFFATYLIDSSRYSLQKYLNSYELAGCRDYGGYLLYEKYTRRDATRILGWDKKQNEQNIGGYKLNKQEWNCPIFVTYHKAENIEGSIAYEDEFLSPHVFKWMSRSNRRIESGELQPIINANKNGLRIPLFVKKDDSEGIDFYYLGDMRPIPSSIEQQYMPDSSGKQLPVVKFEFELDQPVEPGLYKYLQGRHV